VVLLQISVAIIQDVSNGIWVLFDDQRVRQLGTWREVKEYCVTGAYRCDICDVNEVRAHTRFGV
jgi:hypothetical protein